MKYDIGICVAVACVEATNGQLSPGCFREYSFRGAASPQTFCPGAYKYSSEKNACFGPCFPVDGVEYDDSFNNGTCYKKCSGERTTEYNTYCDPSYQYFRPSYSTGTGVPVDLKGQCPDQSYEKYAGLCYKRCKSDYERIHALCYKNCDTSKHESVFLTYQCRFQGKKYDREISRLEPPCPKTSPTCDEGYVYDPTMLQCYPKNGCTSDQDSVGSGCWKECTGAYGIQVGASCFVKATTNFSQQAKTILLNLPISVQLYTSQHEAIEDIDEAHSKVNWLLRNQTQIAMTGCQ